MRSSKKQLNFLAAAIFAAAEIASEAKAACEDLVSAFDRAVAARSIEAASRALGAIGDDIVCGERVDEFRGQLVRFLVTYAETPGVQPSDRERALSLAQSTLEIITNWPLAETLADHFMGSGDKVSAHHWYEKSVSFLAMPGAKATPADRRQLLMKLAAAKSLANDDQGGNKTTMSYVPTMRESDGSPGGIYSRALLRGVEVVPVPVPINFYTNETRFTPLGEKAVQELASVVLAEQVRTMILVGHADPRGEPQYNMNLSRRRVEAVRDELLRKGIRAQITIDWKGATQPFKIDMLPYKVSDEERWQLDRRVEWIRDALP